MATVQTIVGDVAVTGTVTALGGVVGTLRSNLTKDTLQVYPLELQNFRVHDAFQTLIGSAAADDLGITAGAFGTGTPYLHSGDQNALGAYTRYARTMFALPPEYVAGDNITLKVWAGQLTSMASVSSTVDAGVYKAAKDTLISGSDLIVEAAQSCNSLTFAGYSFTVTPSGLTPGDLLDIRLALIGNSATASSHFAAIPSAEILLTVKG